LFTLRRNITIYVVDIYVEFSSSKLQRLRRIWIYVYYICFLRQFIEIRLREVYFTLREHATSINDNLRKMYLRRSLYVKFTLREIDFCLRQFFWRLRDLSDVYVIALYVEICPYWCSPNFTFLGR